MKNICALIVIAVLTLSGCVVNDQGLGGVKVLGTADAVSTEEHLRLGAYYEQRGLFDAALNEYRAAVNIDASDSRGHFGAGNVYLKTGSLDIAETAFLRAIELNPTEGIYYNNLAWVYIGMMRPIEAVAMASNALSFDIEMRDIYLDTMGVAETSMGNYVLAEQYLKEAAIIVSPVEIAGQIQIYEHLLGLYRVSGNQEAAAVVRGKLINLRRGIPAIMDF